MYVEKFTGDTLDEALQQVKRKLGPDAIILKTISNKGIKGALKKSKIEITAAISEQQYVQKSRVDSVLTEQQRDEFYQENPSQIAQSIRSFNSKDKGGYGGLGLNKVVNTINRTANMTKDKIRSGLDDFLGAPEEAVDSRPAVNARSAVNAQEHRGEAVERQSLQSRDEFQVPAYKNEQEDFQAEVSENSNNGHEQERRISDNFLAEFERYRGHIQELESKYANLAKQMEKNFGGVEDDNTSDDFKEIKITLRSLGISDPIIKYVVKKADFELSPEQRNDENVVIDFLLRVLAEIINVDIPKFAKVMEKSETSKISVLVSDFSCGQTSTSIKVCSNLEKAKLICFNKDGAENKFNTAIQMFNIDYQEVSELSALFLEIRKASEVYENVVVDFKVGNFDKGEFKRFHEGLKRSFDNFEILLNISAIHSETYNRKTMTKYKGYIDGVIINQLDLCMEFGPLINIHYATGRVPYVYFSTGATLPDDFELASKERILSGMFNI